MTLYRVSPDKLEAVPDTTFAAENLLERKDLQRLLRQNISVLGANLLVIAEEFGEWEESSRRIDLLCLSTSGSLVVVEVKRTEDGGHMELQAIRYAAMVSSMTLDQAIAAYAQLSKSELEMARRAVLDFLELESVEEAELTGDVRIILVAANFSTEITTSVLWLNRHDLDITCIRMRPYRLDNAILVDATQIIPLPEAAEYEIKLREQEKEKRKVLGTRQQILRKFWEQFIERSKLRTELMAGRNPTSEQWLSAGVGRAGFSLTASLTSDTSKAECYINPPGGAEKSDAAFAALQARKIEIETQFGEPLEWQDLPGRIACRICKMLPGGWQSPETEWPAIQDRLIDCLVRLERALKAPIQELTL
jgi:hypothetical protein